jgi:hypothetical protein
MSEPALLPPPSRDAFPDSDRATGPDPRVARAEQRLAMLRELAELGMALTRELTRRTLEAPEELPTPPAAKADPRTVPGPRHDPAESFARLSRAVRLTLALEATVEGELSDLRAGGIGGSAASPLADDANDRVYEDLPRDYPSAHRNRIRDAVHEVINREIVDLIPAHEVLDTLYERLTEGERYDVFVHRPLKEAVAAICEDLGLHPDWGRWTGEGWPPPPEGPRHAWQMLWAPRRGRVQERRRQ